MATKTTGPTAPDDKVRETLERVKQVKRDFEERDKLYQEIEQVIYNKKPPRVPRGYPNVTRVQSPLASHIVNTITAALSMNPYAVQFDPVNIGPSGEQNASLREHFFNASWIRQEQEKRRRIFRIFMHSLVAKGEGIVKTIERSKRAWGGYDAFSAKLSDQLTNPDDPEYGDLAKRTAKTQDFTERDRVFNARTEEKKREMPYPIETTDVPPETFYYIKGEDGFSFAAEVKTVPYYSTLERYGKDLSSDGKVVPAAMGLGRNKWAGIMSGAKELTMYEAWDWKECRYILCGPGDDPSNGNGQFVRSVPHKYGDKYLKTLRGPYFHSYGITTSSRENHLMGLSVLFGWLKLFPWLDELLTIQGASAYQYGYGRFKRKGGPDDAGISSKAFGRDEQDKIDREQDVEPGAILPWDIEPVDLPKSGPDLGEAITICRDLIRLCLPDIVQGVTDSDQSGYLAAQATHLARLVWQPIVDNAQFCLAERTAFESRLIDEIIGEKVYVWGQEARPGGLSRKKPKNMWLGLGPDDIRGCHAYTVRLNPSTPSQDVIKVRTHNEMLKLKLETQAQAVTDMGNNPEEVEMGWLLDTLKAQLVPEIIAQAQAAILAKQQAQANRTAEADATSVGGSDNGRLGMGDVIEPGQNGEPLQPTPPGQAGVADLSPAGPIPATPVVPSPAPASAEAG